jgi:MFS family permease
VEGRVLKLSARDRREGAGRQRPLSIPLWLSLRVEPAVANRWTALGLLFAIRFGMAFQFQAAAALSPFLMDRFAIGLADIGLLIGLYFASGVLVAMPGAAIGRRFGDERTVAFGMVLMLVGGLAVALVPSWQAQIAGRVVAGIGGILLNVLMSKMVIDRFQGPGLAAAMGIFVNSWPVGIAAALLVLPPIAAWFGLEAALGTVAGLVLVGLVLLLALPRPASRCPSVAAPAPARLRGSALGCVLLAGSIWALYNAGLGVIFGFGPAMLVERGWSAAAASSTTSLALWMVALSIPLGGLIASRLGRDRFLAASLGLFALLLLLAPWSSKMVAMFIVLGLAGGLAAGPIMSLPGDVLSPGNRASGMGMFHTPYYATMFIAPAAAGQLSQSIGTVEAAFLLAAGMVAACLLLQGLFRLWLLREMRAAPAA